MIKVYSKDNCPFCERAKTLLEMKNKEYVEIKIGRDISRENFMELFPTVRTVPHILDFDGAVIGGYEKLVEVLKS